MAGHTYTNQQFIQAPVGTVLAALAAPTDFMPDIVCVADGSGRPRAGDHWRESRRSLLFLRDWALVTVLSISGDAPQEEAPSLQLAMDDGRSRVLLSYTVRPAAAHADGSSSSSSSSSSVTETVECYERHGGSACGGGAAAAATPSERLARMFRKADQKLLRLKAHLEEEGRNNHALPPPPPRLPLPWPLESASSCRSNDTQEEFSFGPPLSSPDTLSSCWFSSSQA